MSGPAPGRWCQLHQVAETPADGLRASMDFREPRHRRAVFLSFYEFHLKHRTHPGLVYALMPWLAARRGWTTEQKLWFAFINGCTQNPVTSLAIFNRMPTPDAAPAWMKWFEDPEVYGRLAFDTDRRYHKKSFPTCVAKYLAATKGAQEAWFSRQVDPANPRGNFRRLWGSIGRAFYSFGRLSRWSYMEYLSIMGLPLEPATLMLEDMDGSKSHRNGLCKVLGRDDLDWHDSNPGFDGRYGARVVGWLSEEAEILLAEARGMARGRPWERDVGFLTMESALCTYKSWHRPNRRYPNVYADMHWGRVQQAREAGWGPEAAEHELARQELLPQYLRTEDCPRDPGVVPSKQNYYLETGRPVMMSRDYPVFACAFDDQAWEGAP